MKSALVIVIAGTIMMSGCGASAADDPKSLIAMAKDNMAKAKKYHDLANEAKLKQAALQGFIAGWVEECRVKGFQLEMQPDGDPACVQKQAPPPPVQPTPPGSVPNSGPVPTPGMSRPSTTNTPITPAAPKK